MIRVSTCCGCCGLKIGLYVYTVLILILRAFYLVSLFVEKEEPDLAKELSYAAIGYTTVTIIILLLSTIGIWKENRAFIIPYMVTITVEIVVGTILLVSLAVAVSPMFLVPLLMIGLDIYVFICFSSYCKELEENELLSIHTIPSEGDSLLVNRSLERL